VAGSRWVGSQGPTGGDLSLRQTSGPLECGPGMPEGHGPGKVKIMRVCGLQAS
jgi:hypothetical protein